MCATHTVFLKGASPKRACRWELLVKSKGVFHEGESEDYGIAIPPLDPNDCTNRSICKAYRLV